MIEKNFLPFDLNEYTLLVISESIEKTEIELKIDEIPDLLKILFILNKTNFLFGDFMRKYGVKGLNRSELLRHALVVKIAFCLFKEINSHIISRLMKINSRNFGEYNVYIFSNDGIFWRRVSSHNNGVYIFFAIKKDLLVLNCITNMDFIVNRQRLSFLFEIEEKVNVFYNREKEAVCEF